MLAATILSAPNAADSLSQIAWRRLRELASGITEAGSSGKGTMSEKASPRHSLLLKLLANLERSARAEVKQNRTHHAFERVKESFS